MRAAVPVLMAACAHAPAIPPQPQAITDLSHSTIEAYDRGDVPALAARLDPTFVRFEGGEPAVRDKVLDRLAKRNPKAPHIGSRTWSHEHTYVHPDSAVFIGEASERMAGNDVHGGYNYEGYYTLAWRRIDSEWKLVLWTWKTAGEAAERDNWNETFRNSIGFNHEPNRLLVDTVKGATPGTALDVAMGQGRNALYLASQGWKVTGVDFSDEGLRLAHKAATEKHLELETENADLTKYDFGVAKWDLVTMIYAGADVAWIDKIKRSLKPGGLFVAEYFHNGDDVKDGFDTGQLAKLFADGFDILRDDVVDDVPDWGMDKAKLVRFVAKKR
ncbi:MAG TPA: methyltransferase domain-containing protein [Kofleriaceae bacterium]|nr:methyltransferase domain-containing protein [Kofleriaceae bacterium]